MKRIILFLILLTISNSAIGDEQEFLNQLKQLESTVFELEEQLSKNGYITADLRKRYLEATRKLTILELMVLEENEDVIKATVFTKRFLLEMKEQKVMVDTAYLVRDFYVGLIKSGFTESEAMQIVSNQDFNFKTN